MQADTHKTKVLYFDVSGDRGGSVISLLTLLTELPPSIAPTLCFGTKPKEALWTAWPVHTINAPGLHNTDFFQAGFNLPWIYHLIKWSTTLPRTYNQICSVLKKEQPDLVHINGGQGLLMGYLAHRKGIPVIWHIRELIPPNRLGKIQQKIYTRCATQIIAISKAVASRLPLCQEKVNVIVNPVERPLVPSESVAEFQKKHSLDPSKTTLLLLGNFTLNKGYGFLADVVENLKKNAPVTFLIAGDVKDPKAGFMHHLFRTVYRKIRPKTSKVILSSRWKQLATQKPVILPGYIPSDVAIASCDLVVCPNLIAEPFGRTVAEAYAQKKPVIANKIEAFDEFITHEVSGWLLEPKVHVWAQHIEHLCEKPDLLASMGKKGGNLWLAFDPKTHSKSIINIYHSALPSKAL